MSISKSTAIIQLSLNYIKDDNLQGLSKILNVMPLDQLSGQADRLLSTYLSVCAAYNRVEATKIILKAWRVVYPPEEKMQILSRLFLIDQINLQTLSFVILNNDSFTYVELMDDLIEYDSSQNVISACQKADAIFGPQVYETYKLVSEHAYDIGNDNVYDYAIERMEDVAPYAPVPAWVNNELPVLPFESELVNSVEIPNKGFVLPNDTETVELLTKGLSHLGISVNEIEEAKKFLYQRFRGMTNDEKREVLRPVIETDNNLKLTRDRMLFRIFGPSNPLVDQDLSLNTPSSKYGGCRMYLDQTFDYDEEFGYVRDWFTGNCSICNRRVKYYWHAVRKPRPMGGWTGCYCSWDHARESIFLDGDEPDLLTHELINIFEREITSVGIQDRLENKE